MCNFRKNAEKRRKCACLDDRDVKKLYFSEENDHTGKAWVGGHGLLLSSYFGMPHRQMIFLWVNVQSNSCRMPFQHPFSKSSY